MTEYWQNERAKEEATPSHGSVAGGAHGVDGAIVVLNDGYDTCLCLVSLTRYLYSCDCN